MAATHAPRTRLESIRTGYRAWAKNRLAERCTIPIIEYLTFETFRDVTLEEFDFLREYGFTPAYDASLNTSFRSKVVFVGRRSALVFDVDIREDYVDVLICPVVRGVVQFPDDRSHIHSLWDVFPDPEYVAPTRAQFEREHKKRRRKRHKQTGAEYLREVYAFEIGILKARGQSFLADQA